MVPTDRYRQLYGPMYSGGNMKNWRDIGAIEKSINICRLWQDAGRPKRPRVVEIGCGDGAVAERLEQVGFYAEYQGFDLSAGGIAEAKRRQVPGATFVVVDSDVLPVESDSADLVIMSHIVEHLEHPRALLYEARRIAKSLIVEVPLEQHIRQPRDFVFDDLGHINAYTATSIRRLVQSCNFRVLKQTTTNVSFATRTFFSLSFKAKAAWHIKERLLQTTPRIARGLFTYHETLLAERVE